MGGSRSPGRIISECGFIVDPIMREGTWITVLNECPPTVHSSIMAQVLTQTTASEAFLSLIFYHLIAVFLIRRECLINMLMHTELDMLSYSFVK